MFDFVWRGIAGVCIGVLSLLPFALTGAVELLFGGLLLGAGGLTALSQVGFDNE